MKAINFLNWVRTNLPRHAYEIHRGECTTFVVIGGLDYMAEALQVLRQSEEWENGRFADLKPSYSEMTLSFYDHPAHSEEWERDKQKVLA